MRIWAVAAERLKDMALKCPELKEKLHLPHHAPKCWQISMSGWVPCSCLANYCSSSVFSFNLLKKSIIVMTAFPYLHGAAWLLERVRPVLRPYTKKVNHQKARDIAYLFEEKRWVMHGLWCLFFLLPVEIYMNSLNCTDEI